MNDDHQGISHGPNLIERISPRLNPRSFSWCFKCVGDPPPSLCFSLLPFYSRFFSPDWGPQGRYLSHPPLPPVVGSGCMDREYGCIRHKALNTIKAAFPCTLLFYLSFFSTFVLSLPCGTVWSFVIHGLLPLLLSAISIRGGFSMAEEGFFHGLGPWPSIDIQTGLLLF